MGPLRIVKSPDLYAAYTWKTSSGQGEMKRCLLLNIGKNNSIPLYPTDVIARRRVLLTSSVSRVKLQFTEDGPKQALF
jgi:hypothetical protein